MTAEPAAGPELAFFAPCPERAQRLDARMRERLARSLEIVCERAAGVLAWPERDFADFLARLRRGPVAPQTFGAYYDLVIAIEREDYPQAEALLRELAAQPNAASELRIVDLGDPRCNAAAARTQRLIDTDPTAPFALCPPPRELAEACRSIALRALARLDRDSPQLAAEIRALLREIVLAVGPAQGDQLVFDGASSFMLWGGIVLNASSHDSELSMIQALAHESAHNLLFGLATDGPLVENSEERFPSPLREDPRPLDGILHATFVCARMHQAVAALRAGGHLRPQEHAEAEEALVAHRSAFEQGLATLDRHAHLTPMGRAALAGARAYMQST